MNIINPNKNINRKNYTIITIITSTLISIIVYIFEISTKLRPEIINEFTLIPLMIAGAVPVYIQIVTAIGRTKDIGISPYWNFCFAIPVLNAIYGLYLIFKKNHNKANKFSEESMYEVIAKEINTASHNKGLWLKAYAKANGDEAQTKIKYINLRLKDLKNSEIKKEIECQSTLSKTEKNKLFMNAIIAIFLIASIPYTLLFIALSNDSMSEKVTPRPFSFKVRYDATDCSVNSYNFSNSIQEIEASANDGGYIAYTELPRYYLYSKNKDFEKAHYIMQKRISSKAKFYTYDMYLLGTLYECGYSVAKDINKAIEYYKESKNFTKISTIYMTGKEVKTDFEKAFFYLSLEEGEYKADLSGMHYHGLGTPKDLRKSFKLLQQTINYFDENKIGADIEDYFNLGLMYYYGFGTFRSEYQAKKYFLKTINSSNEPYSNASYTNDIVKWSNELIGNIDAKK